LESAGIGEAAALVLAIDDPDSAVRIAAYVRRRHPDVQVIARAHDRHHVYRLHAAGAQHQVREVFDSAVRAGRYALAA
ncbi:NAD-binding protein, partial [Salmonella enterica subsp. enterica serovar 1,4,[5],12:i:-]